MSGHYVERDTTVSHSVTGTFAIVALLPKWEENKNQVMAILAEIIDI